MKIAMAPLWSDSINPASGGSNAVGRICGALGSELTRRGHEVVYFAAGDSRVDGRLVSTIDEPFVYGRDWEAWPHQVLAGESAGLRAHPFAVAQLASIAREPDFDVIHFHWAPQLIALPHLASPVLLTMHSPLDAARERGLLHRYRGVPLVSVSNAQRTPIADLNPMLNWVGTVHNGLHWQSIYDLGRGGGGYVVHLGRIQDDKGSAEAIQIALQAGIPIKLAGDVMWYDRDYFDGVILPLARANPTMVEILGEVTDVQKNALLGGALALLAPNNIWDSLATVNFESLACGTPVLTTSRGGGPEAIGPHGRILDTQDEFAQALRELADNPAALDRAACRAWVIDRFSVERMADGYERAYTKAIEGRENQRQIAQRAARSRPGHPADAGNRAGARRSGGAGEAATRQFRRIPDGPFAQQRPDTDRATRMVRRACIGGRTGLG